MKTKSSIYDIPEDICLKAIPDTDDIIGYYYDNCDEIGLELSPYVKEHYPQIERGDALKLGILLGRESRKGHFMFWDGEKVIPQCNDYYDGDGAGPPLCFKTFTEFPLEYFEEVSYFGYTVYLDYDTFVDQIRNLTPVSIRSQEESDAFITYKDQKYYLIRDCQFCDTDMYTIDEYIEKVQQGESQFHMLVNSNNKIVNMNGEEVY